MIFRRFLYRSRANRKGLTVPNAKRLFATDGWEVRDESAYPLQFFVRRDNIGLVAVCLSHEEPSQEDLLDVARAAEAQHASAVILTASNCSAGISDLARTRRVLVRTWPEVAGIQAGIAALATDTADQLREAKLAILPLPPLLVGLMPLTPAQEEAGFVARTENVLCWFDDRGGDTLLIVFASGPIGAEGHAKSFDACGREMQVSTAGFEMSALNWFPADDLETCVDALMVRVAERFPNRTLFGVGPGGFAALRYGRRLSGTLTIAVSPQYSIDPSIVEDRRFAAHYNAAVHAGMHIRAETMSSPALLLYDPYDADDAAHVAAIRGIGEADLVTITVPFAGYACSHLVGRPRFLAGLVEHAWKRDYPAIVREVASLRTFNWLRGYHMALYLSTRWAPLANRLFQSGIHTTPKAPWEHVSYRLANNGYASEVLVWTCEAAARKQGDAEAQAVVALVALKASELDVAFKHIQRSLAEQPTSERYIYIESLIVAARNELPAAPVES